jgi:hypothetical protein
MSILSKFPSKYLKGDDIEVGETVTIKRVRDELVGRDQDAKPVIYFDEHDRGIVLNLTNAKALVKVFGDEEDSWAGKRVTLFTEMTRNPNTGEMGPAIRMQAVTPSKSKKQVAEEVSKAVDGDTIPWN